MPLVSRSISIDKKGETVMNPLCHFLALSLVVGSDATALSQGPDINQLLNDPKRQEEIIEAMASKHDLVMKLIEKLSNRPHFVHMMKERYASSSPVNKPSGYVGEETRSVKALSEEEIQGYLNGEGMGLAKPAELNGYPGPRHVLDLANQLHLSERVKGHINEVFNTMHSEAVRLGRSVVDRERTLDTLFRTKTIDSSTLQRAVVELGGIYARLRTVHLRAHLSTAALLSSEEIAAYKKLRGYSSNVPHTDP